MLLWTFFPIVPECLMQIAFFWPAIQFCLQSEGLNNDWTELPERPMWLWDYVTGGLTSSSVAVPAHMPAILLDRNYCGLKLVLQLMRRWLIGR